MKKNFWGIGILVFSVLFLSGCSLSSQNTNNQEDKTEQKNESVSDMSANSMDNGGGMSALDWSKSLAEGKKLRCSFRDEEERDTTLFVEGNRYRMEYMSPEGKTFGVFDGDAFYTWSDAWDGGFFINTECMNQLNDTLAKENSDQQATLQNETTYDSPEEIFNNNPGMACEEADFVDVSKPETVPFQDQCQLIRDQMKQLEGLQGGELPEGIELPEGVPIMIP